MSSPRAQFRFFFIIGELLGFLSLVENRKALGKYGISRKSLEDLKLSIEGIAKDSYAHEGKYGEEEIPYLDLGKERYGTTESR